MNYYECAYVYIYIYTYIHTYIHVYIYIYVYYVFFFLEREREREGERDRELPTCFEDARPAVVRARLERPWVCEPALHQRHTHPNVTAAMASAIQMAISQAHPNPSQALSMTYLSKRNGGNGNSQVVISASSSAAPGCDLIEFLHGCSRA